MQIGQGGERFEGVREIAVLRGGGLGDLMFAMPAIEALAATYPDARLTLLGTPAAKALLDGRTDAIHAVEELPVHPGVRDSGADAPTLADFEHRLRGRFDLAVQLHGGGRNSNPFLLRLQAPHTVGTATEDAEVLERWVRYVYYQHEVLRGLEVAALAGAEPVTLDPRITVTDDERAAVRTRLGVSGTLIAMHPGATDPRRRWSPDRFAAVAVARLAAGDDVVLVGDASDRPAADAIVAAVRKQETGGTAERLHDLVGTLPLSELPAVLGAADVMVGDDSGPRHLAVAVGTRTVGVFWFGNVVNAGPMDRGRHRVHMSFVTRCPVCGIDVTQVGWTAERCEHDPSYVDQVTPEQVLADVEDLLRTR
ncbi:glycosyltransferase family 9 protein [Curtobacterium sp. VKM Ac-2922]|uniref:glycosyltransferase family 9 protein n=1 Tax=Curtobacterium sp. VKM Ac-2922 TaxID=2929475 RepID=UPI001FB2D91A|nr:glycosyltransferase family 9 protein [Curtobacterium sp. VKM Ac-2922]MCJ1714888.1 glycosyltransferase family 9 protein [Curtobacterium sp. VKM Ac-2922]